MCLAHIRTCRPPVSQYSCSHWPTACSQRSLTCSTRCLVDGVHEGCWVQASVCLMLPASQDAAAESHTQASSASGTPWARADSWPEALQHCIFRLPSDSENPGGFLNCCTQLWHFRDILCNAKAGIELRCMLGVPSRRCIADTGLQRGVHQLSHSMVLGLLRLLATAPAQVTATSTLKCTTRGPGATFIGHNIRPRRAAVTGAE